MSAFVQRARPSGDAPNVLRPSEEQRAINALWSRRLLAALGNGPEPNPPPEWLIVTESKMPAFGPGASCVQGSLTCKLVGGTLVDDKIEIVWDREGGGPTWV